jgi:hypothetical protein
MFSINIEQPPFNELFRQAGIAIGVSYSLQRYEIFKLILEHRQIFEKAMADYGMAVEYFLTELGDAKNPAFFDLGLRSTVSRVLSEITNRTMKAYLFHCEGYRSNDSSVESYCFIQPSNFLSTEKKISESVYEPIFSDLHEESIKGYKNEKNRVEAVREIAKYTHEARNICVIQQGMMAFCEECLLAYEEQVQYMNSGAAEVYLRIFDILNISKNDVDFLRTQYFFDNPLLSKSGVVPISARNTMQSKQSAQKLLDIKLKRHELLLAWIFGSLKSYVKFKSRNAYDYWANSKNPFYRCFRVFCKKPEK